MQANIYKMIMKKVYWRLCQAFLIASDALLLVASIIQIVAKSMVIANYRNALDCKP